MMWGTIQLLHTIEAYVTKVSKTMCNLGDTILPFETNFSVFPNKNDQQ